MKKLNIFRRLLGAVKSAVSRVVAPEPADYQAERLSFSDETCTLPVRERPSVRATYSRRDLALPSNAFAVKRKLGRAYFTRGLSQRTRAARLHSLKPHERALAQAYGWAR